MKNKKYYILVIVLFVLGSSYRFIQLNKDIWGEELYTQVSEDSSFNINGVSFEVGKPQILESQDNLNLKIPINLYKDGEITSQGFRKTFLQELSTSIRLNITNEKGNLVENYQTSIEQYYKDNSKFIEIEKGLRDLGEEKESLTLTFEIDKNILEKVKDNIYSMKLVFPKDDYDLKFNFMDINFGK